ncbi:CDP-glycerol glycerophosphotransferase family protein [Paenibacillus tyrfis]|uniref:CDP-glycerol glycerophosphotransferase family protein n=1 Tax=Paenibacillus tyrfis TaxID=1501230 RepID=UPI0020A20301|nr:CDP-glycerol glycerophosphotransferase family protein [Paenibacillus tyrfis]MCP1306861.1 CDP-glycerol glycerophosphotransferase family protein [Paenibacillus tyrfis]
MFGGDEFNAHLLLRYGYTHDLFERFSQVVYKGVELPLTLLRPYHVLIRDFIDRKREDESFVERKRKQWSFRSMKDVQRQLQRLPPQREDWGKDASRDMILLCGQYVDFALSELSDRRVLLLHSNPYDLRALQGKSLPSTFEVYSLHERLLRSSASQQARAELFALIDEALADRRGAAEHEIFSMPRFPEWMRSCIGQGIVLVDLLEGVLKQYPVGVIMDHSELIYPGSILSLLARSYGLPFINVQNHLTSDASMIPTRATHYAVWGPSMTQWLVERGIDESSIVEVGSLRLEHNERRIQKTREQLLRECCAKPAPFVLVYTTESYPESINFTVMRWMRKLVRMLPDVQVIVKPHPSDKLSYESFVSERIHLAPSGFDLQDILNASDCVATISSTTAIEGAMLKKGIIVLQPELPYDYHINYNGYPYFLDRGQAGPVVHSARELVDCIAALLTREGESEAVVQAGQQFLRQMVFTDDRTPSQRMGGLVKSLLDNECRQAYIRTEGPNHASTNESLLPDVEGN